MPRTLRTPLLVAAAGLAGLALVWVAAYHVPALREADGELYAWLQVLSWDRFHGFAYPLLAPMWPPFYALLSAATLWVAWRRRGPATAAAAFGVLAMSNLVTQVLKEVSATDRPWSLTPWSGLVDAVSWPSGHATASAALAVAVVLATAPGSRRRMAVALGVWVLLVGAAVVWISWHMPSDSLGAWCVVAATGGTTVAGLRAWERRRAGGRAPHVAAAQSSA